MQRQGGKMVLHITHSTHTSVGCIDGWGEVFLTGKIKEGYHESF